MEELKAIENELIKTIVNFNGDLKDLNYFTDNINTDGLNLSELYIAALYNNRFELAEQIIQTGNYKISEDMRLQNEFVNWCMSENDDCIIKCLNDGFIPDVWKTQEILSLLEETRSDFLNNVVYGNLFLVLRRYKIEKILNSKIQFISFSQTDKNRFINYCLESYHENGRNNCMYIQIDNQEEEQEPVVNALHIVLEFFLLENPELRELHDEEREMFFNYIYGDYDLEEKNINDLLMVFKNGRKHSIY